MNFKKSLNIKQKFFLVQILAGLVPLIIASIILSILLSSEKSRREALVSQVHNQTKMALFEDIQQIENTMINLKQSAELLEYLFAPSSLRQFLENRIYAKIQELEKTNSSSLSPTFTLIDSDKHAFIQTGRNLNKITTDEIFKEPIYFELNNQYFLVHQLIRLDDQFRDGPNAKIVGAIEVSIPYENILKKYPQIQSLDNYQGNNLLENLNIVYNHDTTDFNFIWISLILIYVSSIFSGFLFLRRKILLPIQKLSDKVLADIKDVEITTAVDEIDFLDKSFAIAQQQQKQLAQAKAAEIVARQVSHDICSPLSALNLMMSSLEQVPEERRILIRNAVQRINDIANSLLAKSKKQQSAPQSQNKLETEMLSSIIDSLVSEKRIQYRDKSFVDISADLNKSYGLFSNINAVEFKRMLSNLINNSIEAAREDQKLKVQISIEQIADKILIRVRDNGKGIPQQILSQLGKKEISDGKVNGESGFGIGIYHAFKTIQSFGGQIKINSEANANSKQSTEVSIMLPKAKTPNWFVEKISIPANTQLISLDDDISIHQIWSGRLSSIKAHQANITHLTFNNESDLKSALHQININQSLLLVDYELLGQTKSGLDIIEEISLEYPQILSKTILVTSRFEETNIRTRCARLGIKLIPKMMVGFVDISIVI